jgi:uncharacterized membrane protein
MCILFARFNKRRQSDNKSYIHLEIEMTTKKLLGPAATYSHKNHHIKNINNDFQSSLSRGQRIADWIARVIGSWRFIVYQTIIIVLWLIVNSYTVYMFASDANYFKTWDPYPFILLNLILSFQAAYTGPVVMMSQNRLAEKDRMLAEHDYHINLKSEEEIKVIMEHLVYQDKIMAEILAKLDNGKTRSAKRKTH